MKLHILGSCSGTEPMPGRHHTSLALETGGSLYFLDAGENCGYSSYLLGIDQLRTRSIFISHTHMDHVGGLPHLLWNLRKLCTLSPENQGRMAGRTVHVYLPDLEVFDGVYKMLLGSEGSYETVFSLQPHLVQDGLLQEEGLRVEAFHNLHLGEPAPGERWKSFSFVLAAEGKKLVYSGFPGLFRAFAPPFRGGSHPVGDRPPPAFALCQELKDAGVDFGRVLFYHHGVEILRDFAGELALARQVLGDREDFAQDGMCLVL